MSSFSENLRQAFMESQYELCMANRQTDPHRQQLEQQYDRLFGYIRNSLGEQRKLMLELEALQNDIGGIDDRLIYLQGFIDCVTLLKTIRLI